MRTCRMKDDSSDISRVNYQPSNALTVTSSVHHWKVREGRERRGNDERAGEEVKGEK